MSCIVQSSAPQGIKRYNRNRNGLRRGNFRRLSLCAGVLYPRTSGKVSGPASVRIEAPVACTLRAHVTVLPPPPHRSEYRRIAASTRLRSKATTTRPLPSDWVRSPFSKKSNVIYLALSRWPRTRTARPARKPEFRPVGIRRPVSLPPTYHLSAGSDLRTSQGTCQGSPRSLGCLRWPA